MFLVNINNYSPFGRRVTGAGAGPGEELGAGAGSIKDVNSVSAPELKLHLFGGVMLGSTALPGPRAKALILALALSHGQPVSASALIEDVWGADAPASANTALHTMISRIRTSQWHGLITSTDTGYALGIEPLQIDFWAVESLLAAARAENSDPAKALALLAMAGDLTANEAAAGTANSPILEDFRQRTARQRSALSRLNAQTLTAAGDHAGAAAALGTLVEVSALDEPLQLAYLRALSASGQGNQALLAYEQLRRRIRRELGTDPSPELMALQAQLLQGTAAANSGVTSGSTPTGQATLAAGLRQQPSRYSFGLRAAPNELLGRGADIAGVEQLMAAGRLTTILGIGGLGKTRMAQELANRSAQRGTAQVIVVELAAIRTPDDLWLTLADAAGIQEARAVRTLQDKRPVTDLRVRTLSRLAEQPTLLVVDNCEHMVADAAAVIAEILALCPDVTVLSTSRSPLSIAGERLYQLQPLNTGGGQGATVPAAIALFHERALAARASVRLDDAVVQRLCRHLDGLPLAIELAAARVRLMSVEDIEHRLASRFELLVNTDRSAPERHRTLTAVIDWSWELLTASEQAIARRLARFPSGFSLSAARATAGAVPDTSAKMLSMSAVEGGVEALINQSLVLAEEDQATGLLRFRMLETVREFAVLQLNQAGESAAVETAMARWAVEFSLRAFADSSGPEQLETIGRVSAEQENLLHVLRLSLASGKPADAGTVFAIFGLLSNYWSQRGMHGEVFTLAEQVMAATAAYVPEPETVDSAVFSLAVISVTTMIFSLRKGVRARAQLGRIMRAELPLAPRTDAMARLILAAGHEDKAMSLMAALRQDTNDDVAALACLLSGLWAENNGEPGLAITYAERAYQLAEGMADTWVGGSAADNAAQLHSQSGHARESLFWAQRAIERMTLIGAVPDVRAATVLMALNHASVGDSVAARAALERVEAMPAIGAFHGDMAMLETAAAAEIEFASHNAPEGLRLYRSLGQPTRGKRNEGPMGLIMASAQICAELFFNPDAANDPQVAAAVKRLRQTSLATLRLSPRLVDRPVLGTTALAVGSWHCAAAVPGSRRAAVGLELLALAQLMASRQDETVLLRARHGALATGRHGVPALADAQRSVAGLVADKAQATERLMVLFADPSLRDV